MDERATTPSIIQRVGIWKSILDLSLDELHVLYAEIGERVEELMQQQEMEEAHATESEVES